VGQAGGRTGEVYSPLLQILFNESENFGTGQDTRSFLDLSAAMDEGRERVTQQGSLQDLRYLESLHKHCQRHRARLVLSNFEYLDTHFGAGEDRVNRQGNAVLLDVNYSALGDADEAQGYGLTLIAKLLNGTRPYCDVAIVSGIGRAVDKLIDPRAGDEKWWQVRCLPQVHKGGRLLEGSSAEVTLDNELECFIRYFIQSLPQLQSVALVESLLFAQTKPESPGHPKDDGSDVPADFPCRECFVSAEKFDAESFKGAYCYATDTTATEVDGVRYHNNTRCMNKSVLTHLLAAAGIRCDAQGQDLLTLPSNPGILFIIHLARYLSNLKDYDGVVTFYCMERSVKVTIPLDGGSSRLAAAFHTRNTGEATMAFRDLLGCSLAPILRLLERKTIPEHMRTWQPLVRPVLYPVMKHTFAPGSVVLEWSHPGFFSE